MVIINLLKIFIKFQQIRRLTLFIALGLLLNACSTSSAKDTLTTYLEAVANNNTSKAKELFCVPEKYSVYLKKHKYSLENFKVLEVESKSLKNSNIKYDEVYVEQEIEKNRQGQTEKRFYPVWNTDEHYQYMTEKYREYANNPNIQMERSKWSSNSQCIANDSDISTNYELLPLKNPFSFFGKPEESSSEGSDMYREYRQIEVGMDISDAREILKDLALEETINNDGSSSYIWTVPKGKYKIFVRSVDDRVKSTSIRYY